MTVPAVPAVPLEFALDGALEVMLEFRRRTRCRRLATESSPGFVFQFRRQVCSSRSLRLHGEFLERRLPVRHLGGDDAPRRDQGGREFPAGPSVQGGRGGHEGSRLSPPIRSEWRLEEDVAGIETFIHPHDRNASFAVPWQDCGLNRRSAAVARKQRGVDVDASKWRQRENGLQAGSGRRPRQ